jgi:hypothetical protein
VKRASLPRRVALVLIVTVLAVQTSAPARAVDPLKTMRAFCQADGRGVRIDPYSWSAVADLVAWGLEPAWDHLYLIRGFELGTPEWRDGSLAVDVQYTITGEVHSSVITHDVRVETRTYRLERGEGGVWRIRAPAPPPYLFESDVDADALATLLDPNDPNYLSASAFAWRMLRDSGWTIAYADTAALATSADFTTERSAEIGDLALYYDGDQPYQVGIVDSDETIVSSTLNGGIRRTPFAAFAGEIRYRRAIAALLATPTPEPKPTKAKGVRHRKR